MREQTGRSSEHGAGAVESGAGRSPGRTTLTARLTELAPRTGVDPAQVAVAADGRPEQEGALGLADGDILHVAAGLEPGTPAADRVLAHELVHAAQRQVDGPVADRDTLESEADELAGQVVAGGQVRPAHRAPAGMTLRKDGPAETPTPPKGGAATKTWSPGVDAKALAASLQTIGLLNRTRNILAASDLGLCLLEKKALGADRKVRQLAISASQLSATLAPETRQALVAYIHTFDRNVFAVATSGDFALPEGLLDHLGKLDTALKADNRLARALGASGAAALSSIAETVTGESATSAATTLRTCATRIAAVTDPGEAVAVEIMWQKLLVTLPDGEALGLARSMHGRALAAIAKPLAASGFKAASTYSESAENGKGREHAARRTGRNHDYGSVDLTAKSGETARVLLRDALRTADLASVPEGAPEFLQFSKRIVPTCEQASNLHDQAGKLASALRLKGDSIEWGDPGRLYAALHMVDTSAETKESAIDKRLATLVSEIKAAFRAYEQARAQTGSAYEAAQAFAKEANGDERKRRDAWYSDFLKAQSVDQLFGLLETAPPAAKPSLRLMITQRKILDFATSSKVTELKGLVYSGKISTSNQAHLTLEYSGGGYTAQVKLSVGHLRSLSEQVRAEKATSLNPFPVGCAGATGGTAVPHLHIGADVKLTGPDYSVAQPCSPLVVVNSIC